MNQGRERNQMNRQATIKEAAKYLNEHRLIDVAEILKANPDITYGEVMALASTLRGKGSADRAASN